MNVAALPASALRGRCRPVESRYNVRLARTRLAAMTGTIFVTRDFGISWANDRFGRRSGLDRLARRFEMAKNTREPCASTLFSFAAAGSFYRCPLAA